LRWLKWDYHGPGGGGGLNYEKNPNRKSSDTVSFGGEKLSLRIIVVGYFEEGIETSKLKLYHKP
jgi:hypothetical protein